MSEILNYGDLTIYVVNLRLHYLYDMTITWSLIVNNLNWLKNTKLNRYFDKNIFD